MAVKLGDILIQEGLVTPAELEEALKCQVVFGGKLGTNLIEIGALEEGDLARTLSMKMGVPYVNPSYLMNISPDIIKLLPREITEKYKVIPLRLDKRRLTLIMADPTDLTAIDEIAFRTDYIIRPVVTPEVRVIQALEKYYNVKRGLRHIHTTRPKPIKSEKAVAAKALKPAQKPVAEAKAKPPKSSADAKDSRKKTTKTKSEELEKFLELEEFNEFEEDLGNKVDIRASLAKKVEQYSIDPISKELSDARDRDDIANTLSHYIGEEFTRGALFLVKGDIAIGWKAMVNHQPLPDFDQVQIPLNKPSILKTVADNRSFCLGPVPKTTFNSQLFRDLGGDAPSTALLVPLLMMGRVVGIIYVDGGKKDLGDYVFELQKLTTKATMAFEIMALRNKILLL